MSPEIISMAVKEYFAAIRAMDQRAWVNTFAEDAISTIRWARRRPWDIRSSGEFFETITAAFKEVGLTEDEVFIAGNGAAVKWTGRGTSKQGKKVRFEGIDVFEINENGKDTNLARLLEPGRDGRAALRQAEARALGRAS